MPVHRRPALGAKSDEDGASPSKTRDDRAGPGAVLARRAFGPETVELLLTRNGWRRVDWHGRRRWLGGDPETARQTYQRYCLHAFLLDRIRRVYTRLSGGAPG